MDFPPRYWERVEKMLEFAAILAEGGPLPMFGDCDDGYVLDLARRRKRRPRTAVRRCGALRSPRFQGDGR